MNREFRGVLQRVGLNDDRNRLASGEQRIWWILGAVSLVLVNGERERNDLPNISNWRGHGVRWRTIVRCWLPVAATMVKIAFNRLHSCFHGHEKLPTRTHLLSADLSLRRTEAVINTYFACRPKEQGFVRSRLQTYSLNGGSDVDSLQTPKKTTAAFGHWLNYVYCVVKGGVTINSLSLE